MSRASIVFVALLVGCGATPSPRTTYTPPSRSTETSGAVAPRSDVLVARYGPGPAWVPERALPEQDIAGHMGFVRAAAAEGLFVAGGPISDEEGVYLLRSADHAATEARLRTDPGITSGVLALVSLTPWSVMMGALTGPPADGERYFFVDAAPGRAWVAGRPITEQPLADHFAYVAEGVGDGRVVLAGPTGAEHGLYLLRAADAAAVTEILASDPGFSGQVLSATVLPWHVMFASTL
jgi:uncharacterized protein YciI